MPLEQDNEKFDWTDDAIAVLKAGIEARRPRSEVATELQEKFGIRPTDFALASAVHRYCPEERRIVAEDSKRELENNRSRANELMATGQHTVSQIAEIMGVPIHNVYFWIPSAKRPKAIRSGFASYLAQFHPVEVPEDPIVDHGKVLMDLQPEDCRWPVGKDADGAFRFCGCQFHRDQKRPANTRPYCDAHTVMDRRQERDISERGRQILSAAARKREMPQIQIVGSFILQDDVDDRLAA